jgi:acetyl esterase/lipase
MVSSVSSISIPGYWLHKSSKIDAAVPIPGEKIVYALHGGAYTHMSAHPSDFTAAIARGLLKHIDSVHHVFSVEYRLSIGKPYVPANPFPAALLDALAGYNYLVNTVGISPSDIIVEGDSAGGNLALALTRYIIEYGNRPGLNLPAPPGALLLLSPWTDLGLSHETPGSSSVRFLKSDFIGFSGGRFDYAKDAFLGPHGLGAAEINRYISPASLNSYMEADFKAFPRTFIVCGGAEVLCDQIRTLKKRMIRDLGEGNGLNDGEGKVRYYEAKDGVHDYIIFPWHEPERGDTLREIAEWISVVDW